MRYRGLSPLQLLTVWVVFMLVVGAVLGATGPRAVAALADLAQVAPSRLPWVATRVTAFLSYLAITGSVVYGLLLSTKMLDAIAHRPVSFALHQDLAAIGLGLAGIHVVLLGLDATVPFSFAEMLVPFVAPYQPFWVGVGQLTFYVVGIVIASFYVRRRIGQRTWRLLHYLTFLSFVGATAHGVMSGSDSGAAWAWWSYVGATTLVVFLTGYRIVTAITTSRERASRPMYGQRSGPGAGPLSGPRPAPLDLRAPHRGLTVAPERVDRSGAPSSMP
jgi:methionine sulfoxide reductase heme-binding subunit